VARVVPVLTATAFTSDGSGELLAIHAYDWWTMPLRPFTESAQAHGSTFTRIGSLPGSIILTEQFAARHRLRIGNRIDHTPIGRKTFSVVGLIEGKGLARLLRR
jgi:hypothetical protein